MGKRERKGRKGRAEREEEKELLSQPNAKQINLEESELVKPILKI